MIVICVSAQHSMELCWWWSECVSLDEHTNKCITYMTYYDWRNPFQWQFGSNLTTTYEKCKHSAFGRYFCYVLICAYVSSITCGLIVINIDTFWKVGTNVLYTKWFVYIHRYFVFILFNSYNIICWAQIFGFVPEVIYMR